MGIRSDDHITGYCQSFFRKQGMLNSHFSNFKIIGNFITPCKLSDTFAVFRRFDILIGNKVIRNKCDLVLIKNSLCIHLRHFLNGYRTGNIVSKHQIQICFNQLSGFYFLKSGMCCQNFLGHCHSHAHFLLIERTLCQKFGTRFMSFL